MPAASSAASRPAKPIVCRFAVKPTSSILSPRLTVDVNNARRPTSRPRAATTPAVGIRAVPVGEAMMACVLADHALRQRAQMG